MLTKNLIINTILSAFIMQQVLLPSVCTAATLSEVQLINLETMQLATNSVISSLLVSGDIPSTPAQLNTYGYVDNSGVTNLVTGTIAGVPISLDLEESSVGNIGTNINVTVNSTGSYGSTSIFTEGTGVWSFDSTTNSYNSFNYTEHGSGNYATVIIIISVLVYNLLNPPLAQGPGTNTPYQININPQPPSQNSSVTSNGTTNISYGGTNYYPNISGIINENSTVTATGHLAGTITIPEPSTFTLLLFLIGINLSLFLRRVKSAK